MKIPGVMQSLLSWFGCGKIDETKRTSTIQMPDLGAKGAPSIAVRKVEQLSRSEAKTKIQDYIRSHLRELGDAFQHNQDWVNSHLAGSVVSGK
ncbi:MAG: hypothetical protein FJZ58_00915 [Chlamydiae bacterium]|nr:hypothetical protein [Chlamydiota bacterium]